MIQMPLFGIAYKITCSISGKRYIGITKRTLNRRWSAHVLRAFGDDPSASALAAAIRKYGKDNFTAETIACSSSLHDLLETEKILIAQENTKSPNGYNLTAGGEGGFDPAPETRARMRLANVHLGKKQSAEFIEKRVASLRGRKYPGQTEKRRAAQIGKKRKSWGKHTPESIALMKEKCKGRRPSAAAIAGVIKAQTGKKVSVETRARMSASQKKFECTDAGKLRAEQRRQNLIGRKCSPETIAKMKASASRRNRNAKISCGQLSLF